jgi:DNA-binding CsgD family transcriptional regulator
MGRESDAFARVGRFVAEAERIESDEPFPPELLAALQRLVPCDQVAFSELDRVAQVDLGVIWFPREPDDDAVPEIEYWEIRDEHPICHHHEVTRDWSARRLTDFLTPGELRRSRIYAEWFRPGGIEHELACGLDAPLTHTKVFILDRAGRLDFDDADELVLDLVRPYLAHRFEERQQRARLHSLTTALARAGVTVEDTSELPALTAREREVLALVGEGMTNADVAAQLWISIGTVRRHLENVFAKLDVHTRTAAVARMRAWGEPEGRSGI